MRWHLLYVWVTCVIADVIAHVPASTTDSINIDSSRSIPQRQLGGGGDAVQEVVNLVVNNVVDEMIEADKIRKVSYHCAMILLRAQKHSVAMWTKLNEEDAELEAMKTQKEQQI